MAANIVVYGDGACSGNPGPGGWAFLMADQRLGKVIERSGFEAHTTNNRMELWALIATLEELLANHPGESQVEFFWDSAYVVKGFNEWLFNWARRDFTKADGAEISNRELWERVWELKKKSPSFKMTQIPGHSGLPGNERVDELCVAESKREPISGYQGALSEYSISFADLVTPYQSTAPHSGPALKYPAYLSLIEGKIERDLTWDACKARVNGKSAKYKKVKNAVEEKLTLKSWNV